MIRKILASLTMLALIMAVPISATAASSPFDKVPCSQSSSESAVCQDKRPNTNPLTGSEGLIIDIANIIAIISGVAAVIVIVLAGLRFVTSGGSSEDVAGARRTIIYASVGLLVVVLARALVGLILGTL